MPNPCDFFLFKSTQGKRNMDLRKKLISGIEAIVKELHLIINQNGLTKAQLKSIWYLKEELRTVSEAILKEDNPSEEAIDKALSELKLMLKVWQDAEMKSPDDSQRMMKKEQENVMRTKVENGPQSLGSIAITGTKTAWEKAHNLRDFFNFKSRLDLQEKLISGIEAILKELHLIISQDGLTKAQLKSIWYLQEELRTVSEAILKEDNPSEEAIDKALSELKLMLKVWQHTKMKSPDHNQRMMENEQKSLFMNIFNLLQMRAEVENVQSITITGTKTAWEKAHNLLGLLQLNNKCKQE